MKYSVNLIDLIRKIQRKKNVRLYVVYISYWLCMYEQLNIALLDCIYTRGIRHLTKKRKQKQKSVYILHPASGKFIFGKKNYRI